MGSARKPCHTGCSRETRHHSEPRSAWNEMIEFIYNTHIWKHILWSLKKYLYKCESTKRTSSDEFRKTRFTNLVNVLHTFKSQWHKLYLSQFYWSVMVVYYQLSWFKFITLYYRARAWTIHRTRPRSPTGLDDKW